MRILGIYNNNICFLIEHARIIIQSPLDKSSLSDVLEYDYLKVFTSYEEVEKEAYYI